MFKTKRQFIGSPAEVMAAKLFFAIEDNNRIKDKGKRHRKVWMSLWERLCKHTAKRNDSAARRLMCLIGYYKESVLHAYPEN